MNTWWKRFFAKILTSLLLFWEWCKEWWIAVVLVGLIVGLVLMFTLGSKPNPQSGGAGFPAVKCKGVWAPPVPPPDTPFSNASSTNAEPINGPCLNNVKHQIQTAVGLPCT